MNGWSAFSCLTIGVIRFLRPKPIKTIWKIQSLHMSPADREEEKDNLNVIMNVEKMLKVNTLRDSTFANASQKLGKQAKV